MMPPNRAQGQPQAGAEGDSSEEYYSYGDEYESEVGGGPQPGGAPNPPPFTTGGAPPAMPRMPTQPGTIGGDDDYDSYEYEYDEEDAEYAYEYEYDEEYAYEYEYDEEYDDGYEDGDYQSRMPTQQNMGAAIGAAAVAGGMGMMAIDPSMLAAGKNKLSDTPAPEEKPKSSGGGAMFGLTSVNLKNLRDNMKPVESKKSGGGVSQRDFRNQLKPGSGGGVVQRNTNKANVKTPAWAQMQLKQGTRPMTTNIQTVDTQKIKQQVQAAKAKQQNRRNQGPAFLNGAPVGRTSIRRIRQRTTGKPMAGPNGGRVSAKISVNRVQDPNNPNKFLNKQRVSYKVKKRVSANMNGGPTGRVSRKVRVSARNPNRVSARKSKNPNRVSTRKSKNPNRVSARKTTNRTSRNPNRVSARKTNRMSARKARDPNRVSRRHKRPNVSRTSVNQNIFGAKTAPDAEVQGKGRGDGCYLRFDTNDSGTVFAEWNVVGYEANEALAYFKAGVPVPRFNYRRNDGRVVLMSGVSESSTKYYEAWTYFFAMAKEYEGSLFLQDKIKDSKLGVKFVALTKNNQVKRIADEGRSLDMGDWTCVAVLPPDCEIFDQARNADDAFFMNIANQNGMSVKLQ